MVARARPARQGDRRAHGARDRNGRAPRARDGDRRDRVAARAPRRAFARHWQDGHSGFDPAQARLAFAARMGDHAAPPHDRLSPAVADHLPAPGPVIIYMKLTI